MITPATPIYKRTIHIAKFLGIITRKPAHVEMDEPEATAFELVEKIEVVMHHVMMYGLGAFGTQDLGKMNSALLSSAI